MTITPKVFKKTVAKGGSSFEVEILSKKPKGQKNVRRRNKKITIELDNVNEDIQEEQYNYLDCSIYTIENLTDGYLESDMLPLFAIMLGNDFINRRWFSKFYSSVRKRKGQKSRKNNLSPQQKRIHILLNWLQHETLHSAIKKILECVKQYQRPRLWDQIRIAMSGYRMEKSKSYEYFGFVDDEELPESSAILDMTLDEIMNYESDVEEEEAVDSDGSANNSDLDDEQDLEQSDNNSDENEENSDADDNFEPKHSEDEDFIENVETEEEEAVAVDTYQRKHFKFPEWFVNLYRTAATPRFLVDLLRSHRYINYPQVEDYTAPDSNAVSYPILNLIYSILHSPKVPRLYYYTRIIKQVRYEILKIDSDRFPVIDKFDPTQKKNVKFIRHVMNETFENGDEILKMIGEVPEVHQLYVLSIIYWIKVTQSDSNFLKSAIIGLIAVAIVDKKCERIHRDSSIFQKKFEKQLKELKAKDVPPQTDTQEIPTKTLIKNVTKQEALLAMENLIGNFSISSKFTRKHADYQKRVVHTYAQLQSVAYNLYTLNAILNYPYENIKIETYFNGLFLYNMYINLKSRANSMDYIKNHLFRHSTTLFTVFNKILGVCLRALPGLPNENLTVDEVTPKNPKKIKKPKNVNVKTVKATPENDCIGNVSSDNEEFVDLNNKFSQLLKNFE